jgi:hypothetical protein
MTALIGPHAVAQAIAHLAAVDLGSGFYAVKLPTGPRYLVTRDPLRLWNQCFAPGNAGSGWDSTWVRLMPWSPAQRSVCWKRRPHAPIYSEFDLCLGGPRVTIDLETGEEVPA